MCVVVLTSLYINNGNTRAENETASIIIPSPTPAMQLECVPTDLRYFVYADMPRPENDRSLKVFMDPDQINETNLIELVDRLSKEYPADYLWGEIESDWSRLKSFRSCAGSGISEVKDPSRFDSKHGRFQKKGEIVYIRFIEDLSSQKYTQIEIKNGKRLK